MTDRCPHCPSHGCPYCGRLERTVTGIVAGVGVVTIVAGAGLALRWLILTLVY